MAVIGELVVEVAVAVSRGVVLTVDPFAGELTVMPAVAASADASMRVQIRISDFKFASPSLVLVSLSTDEVGRCPSIATPRQSRRREKGSQSG